MDDQEYKGLCERCKRREECTVPCRPVELILREGNTPVFEKLIKRRSGENQIMIFTGNKRMIQESQMLDREGERTGRLELTFSTANGSAFASFSPEAKRTKIFIGRLLEGLSYTDLAIKFDISPDQAKDTYHNAVKRVYGLLTLMDQGSRANPYHKARREKFEARLVSLPKGLKYFLLSRLLELSPAEIAELEGVDRSNVHRDILKVSDQIKAGEISIGDLVEVDDQAEAQDRLESYRTKERERWHRAKDADAA